MARRHSRARERLRQLEDQVRKSVQCGGEDLPAQRICGSGRWAGRKSMTPLDIPALPKLEIHRRLLSFGHPPVVKARFYRALKKRFRVYERMAPTLQRFGRRPKRLGRLLSLVYSVYDSDAAEAVEFRKAIRE